MEDATKPSDTPTATIPFIRRANATTVPHPRPTSVPLETADTTITIPLRRPKTTEEKGNENLIRKKYARVLNCEAVRLSSIVFLNTVKLYMLYV